MAMAMAMTLCVGAAYGHAKDLSKSRTDDNDKTRVDGFKLPALSGTLAGGE